MMRNDWYQVCEQMLEQLMIENQDVLWRMGHEWHDDDEEENEDEA